MESWNMDGEGAVLDQPQVSLGDASVGLRQQSGEQPSG
jgi:hypothetical protein